MVRGELIVARLNKFANESGLKHEGIAALLHLTPGSYAQFKFRISRNRVPIRRLESLEKLLGIDLIVDAPSAEVNRIQEINSSYFGMNKDV